MVSKVSRSISTTACVGVLLLGCDPAGNGADEDAGTTDADLPSPYSDGTGNPHGDAVPSMSREQVVASAMAGLRSFADLRPSGVVEQFEALAQFEEGCPEELSDEVVEGTRILYFYTEGCTTSAGLSIVGGGMLEKWTDRVEDGRTSSGASLSGEDGSFRLARGDRWLEFSGYLDYDAGTYEGELDGYFYVGADASADPRTAEASPLLAADVRAQGEVYAYLSDGYAMLGGSGSMSGPGLAGAVAVSLGSFAVAPEECAKEPGGTMSVRDDNGFWHDVVFDAATIESMDDEPKWHRNACDGCGPYLAAGVEDGSACVSAKDLAPLVDFEGGMPW